MARPGAWEHQLCPVDLNIMHNMQEPMFKLGAPQIIEQPVLSPDTMSYFVVDDEQQQNMSIQQQHVLHNNYTHKSSEAEIVD